MFNYFSTNDIGSILINTPDVISIRIDNSIIGERGIIDHIEARISSPYTNDNWDGFSEAICDLCWLSSKQVRLVHVDLPLLSEHEMNIYLSILKHTEVFWSHFPEDSNCVLIYFNTRLESFLEEKMEMIGCK